MDKILEYQLIELISKSQNTEIYRALNTSHEKVILKLLRDEQIDSEKLARFKKEYEITSQLTSEWIVKPYELLKYQDTFVMVLEDFGGISLNQFIAKNSPCIDKKQLIDLLEVAILITKALNNIHNQDIIHKDINPTNIIYNKEQQLLKIIDFGLATKLKNEQFEPTDETKFEGTYAYISPEQTGRFNRIIDYRTDFYSLGITLYELFSGRLPFNAESPREWIHSHIAKEPVNLNKLNANVPKEISDIVMRLINKTAEYRYQSGFGIIRDLEKCLNDLIAFGSIKNFKLGKSDVSQRFQIPQKLYGRKKEISDLLNFLEKINTNSSSLLLVNGYSGIGKTSIILEMQRPVVKHNGYFVSGKFDQLKKNIPYSAFLQALTRLIKSLLSENKDEIKKWKEKILGNLNGNGQLMTNVIPELEYIIGKQPNLPTLPATESHNRFFSTFLNFIKTFTSKDNPLVLFLDDLHWADNASLEMIESLLTNNQSGALLIIGAYRDNEVDPNHPLLITTEKIVDAGINFRNIHVDYLQKYAVKELLIDAFSLDHIDADNLTELCISKTNGNPFFIIEFLKNLYQTNLLYFNPNSGKWVLESKKIEKSDVAENVAELISKRIEGLSNDVQHILKFAACIGSKFSAQLIHNATKIPWRNVIKVLNKASEYSLIFPISEQYRYAEFNPAIEVNYKFVHDRIQQEIYALIPEKQKNEIHQEIGRYLLKSLAELQQEDLLYTILEHLNKGIEHIIDDEKIFLADLNLQACQKAKRAGAFDHALYFANTSLKLVDKNIWQVNYSLALQIHIETSESLSLCGNFEEMEATINESFKHITSIIEKAKLYEIRILSYIARYRQPDAVLEALDILKLLGTKFPKKPETLHIIINLIKTSRKLRKVKAVNDLKLPAMKNQKVLAAMNIMAIVLSASYYVNPKLFPLIVFKLIQNTLNYGIAPKSPVSFITYGLINYALGKIEQGYLNSQIGMNMFDQLNADEHWSQASCIHNSAVIWKEPVKKSIDGLFSAYKVGIDTGDIEFAVASAAAGLCYKFYAGRDIRELYYETEKYKNSLYYLKQNVPFNQIKGLLQTIKHLIEGPKNPEVLNGEFYSESEMIPHFQDMKDNASSLDLYLKKMFLAYHFKRFYLANEIANEARKIVKDVAGLLLYTLYHYYESLILLANYGEFDQKEFKFAKKRITENQKKLKTWAKSCPANFENKYYLVEAEVEKLNGNITLSSELYDKSILLSQKEGNLSDQALGNELAGMFWLSLNKKEFAQIYLSKAFKLYNIWGATAKANDLKTEFNDFIISGENIGISSISQTATKSSTGTSKITQIIDLETILEAAKAISGEIIFTDLIKKTLSIILEHAGAQRGVLLIKDSDKELRIEAFGLIEKNEINITLECKEISKSFLPASLIRYVERTHETIILHDANNSGNFIQDDYIRNNGIKSIITIPILQQSKFSGILYLENNLSTNVFNQKRVDILTILCTQAAISIENAILYNSMEQKVIDRTKEITKKNKLLQKQKEKIEQARDQLTELNATKDKFFSIIAHDLRGPIANINTFLDLLTKKVIDYNEDKIDEYIERFKETSKKTYDLLNNLLIWAQTQRNEIEYNPKNNSVSDIIKSNLSLVTQNAIEKGIKIENNIRTEIIAYFDNNLIDTVIRNLLNNAMKYVNTQDSIIISLEENNETVIVSIKDTGIGMNSKIKDNLFSIDNKQISRTGTSGEKGTGLGLILCKEFVEKNGGNIWVESEENVGSTFSFSIPKQIINGN